MTVATTITTMYRNWLGDEAISSLLPSARLARVAIAPIRGARPGSVEVRGEWVIDHASGAARRRYWGRVAPE